MKTRAQIALEAEAVNIGTPDNSDDDSSEGGYSTESTMEDKTAIDKGPRQYMPKEQMIQAGADYDALDVITFR